MLRIRFPLTLAVSRGGLFLLTLVTAYGQAQAQVFFLQGQDGQCSSVVTGDLTVTGKLTVQGSIQLPDCPSGYAQDVNALPVVLCTDPNGDEMVRVGDFWIDRYEVTVWHDEDCTGGPNPGEAYGATSDNWYLIAADFPETGNWTYRYHACSLPAKTPSRYMTWFQAQQACAASGKHLCTNDEWQAAAAGTHDTGGTETGTQCHIDPANTGPRSTGLAGSTPGGTDSCISRWGAEDMIGNLWEWTADWFSAGNTWQTGDGQSATPWPAGYGSDLTYNVNGRAHNGTAYVDGLPGAALRGGGWDGGSSAGLFALTLHHGPSYRSSNIGARCCRQQ